MASRWTSSPKCACIELASSDMFLRGVSSFRAALLRQPLACTGRWWQSASSHPKARTPPPARGAGRESAFSWDEWASLPAGHRLYLSVVLSAGAGTASGGRKAPARGGDELTGFTGLHGGRAAPRLPPVVGRRITGCREPGLTRTPASSPAASAARKDEKRGMDVRGNGAGRDRPDTPERSRARASAWPAAPESPSVPVSPARECFLVQGQARLASRCRERPLPPSPGLWQGRVLLVRLLLPPGRKSLPPPAEHSGSCS